MPTGDVAEYRTMDDLPDAETLTAAAREWVYNEDGEQVPFGTLMTVKSTMSV